MADTNDPKMVVDGETFAVTARDGGTDVAWLTGPNPGYGFTSGRTTRATLAEREREKAIRNYLANIDPVTGFIE